MTHLQGQEYKTVLGAETFWTLSPRLAALEHSGIQRVELTTNEYRGIKRAPFLLNVVEAWATLASNGSWNVTATRLDV